MKGLRRIGFILLATIVMILISAPHVYAQNEEEGEVNLLELPNRLSEMLGIPLSAGKLLACTIFTAMFLLPIAIFSKGNMLLSAIVGLVLLGFFITIGWLDFWFILVICLLIAGLWSGKIKEWVTR